MGSNWRIYPEAIDPHDCDNIIRDCRNLDVLDGTTFNGSEQARSSKIRWASSNKGLVDLLYDYILDANRKAFSFDIEKACDVQFTEYDASYEGHYDWHEDIDWLNQESVYQRKLSMTVQLSDPRSYAGGDFEFQMPPEDWDSEKVKAKGTVIVFPSYLRHRVTPVTSGRRYSLVSWFEGPRWR